MNRFKNRLYAMEAKANNFLYGIKEREVIKKDKGLNGVVVEVGIIIVAVVLLVAFNKEVNKLVTDMVTNANTKIQAIFNSQVV